MENKYQYTCRVTINAPIDLITKLIINDELMTKWQKGLTKIEMIHGKNHENGSKRMLHYHVNHQSMEMKETIQLNQLPERLIQIYEMENVWNQCDNRFKARDQKTLWIMKVIFKFSNQPPAPKKAFENKTYDGMEAFKRFAETYKNGYKD